MSGELKSTGYRPRYRGCLWGYLFAGCLLAGVVVRVQAQPSVSQAVTVQDAVLDEFGLPLQGNDPAAKSFGLPVVEGDLVQVLHATDGTIYPPDVTGQPDPRNVVLATSRIGRGTSPTLLNSGRFGAAVTPRPGGNSRIFVRVFNAPTAEEASFYGDSQLFTVRSWKNEVFTANISATTIPLDAADSDGDGLNNSWEKSYGADPGTADTDGDGLSDAEEVVAGTDLLDSESSLVMAQIIPAGGADVLVRWDSTAGTTYVVQYAGHAPGGEESFQDVGTVVGEGAVSELLIPGGLADDTGCFRVFAVAD